uniref:Uncharacterized protein n=1 Tax=Noctiluca scintillans TaxID=2966 RepID=A0A7S1A5K1_NOCSC
MRQDIEYHIMQFRIRQAELWREDVRDIIGLTSVKMDTYLIVNAVQLGFCVMAFCEGRLASGTPEWLIGCHTLSLVGAFLYLLMSVWLAMHASVAAKSYEVRLLTQLVRLPVPSWSELEGARTYASQFEAVEGRQMFRVPVVMGTQDQVLASTTRSNVRSNVQSAPSNAPPDLALADEADAAAIDDVSVDQPVAEGMPLALGPQAPLTLNSLVAQGAEGASEAAAVGPDEPVEGLSTVVESVDPWGLERSGEDIFELDGTLRGDPRQLRHVMLVQEAMRYWQAYDGFARVSMSMGSNQLVTALSYYVIGYVLIANHGTVAAWSALILFLAIQIALIRLDLSMTGLEFYTSCALIMIGPIITAIAAYEWALNTDWGQDVVYSIAPVPFFSHAMWLGFLMYLSKVREQKGGALLPTAWRSVLYIDVFGWIKQKMPENPKLKDGVPAVNRFATVWPFRGNSGQHVPGKGPAIEEIVYADQKPVPQRPEDVPGASSAVRGAIEESREHFDPSSFVPRERGHFAGTQNCEGSYHNPGGTPWRVFCWATLLLTVLWVASGLMVVVQCFGITPMEVTPLLRETVREIEDNAINGNFEVEPEFAQSAISVGAVGFLQTLSSTSSSASSWSERLAGAFVSTEIPYLLGGRELPTRWPHMNIRPGGLACDGARGTMVASTRFGLFTGEFAADSSPIRFQQAPPCEAIEGEALQDVALACGEGTSPSACHALVLHRHGRKLATCGISLAGVSSEVVKRSNSSHGHQFSNKVAQAWLKEEAGESAEEVSSIVFTDQCHAGGGGKGCAFVETTGQRIVELDSTISQDAGGDDQWVPTRMLQAESRSRVGAGGTLHLVQGQFLGVLRSNENVFEVLDPQAGGSMVGQWKLPRGANFVAMCSVQNNLYFLGDSPSPQIWSFPLPSNLRVDPVPVVPGVGHLETDVVHNARKRGSRHHVELGASSL